MVNVLTKGGFSIDWKILTVDYDSKCNHVNRKLFEQIGRKLDEDIRKHVWEIWKDYTYIFLSVYGSTPLPQKWGYMMCMYAQLQCSNKLFRDLTLWE